MPKDTSIRVLKKQDPMFPPDPEIVLIQFGKCALDTCIIRR